MKEAVGADGNLKIFDIFAVPDYSKLFQGHFDPKFGCYSKKETTQLQFIFEAVPKCANFPLGCRTTYRAYSQDKVIEIARGSLSSNPPDVTIYPRECKVTTFPLANPELNIPSGMKCKFDAVVAFANAPLFVRRYVYIAKIAKYKRFCKHSNAKLRKRFS